MDLEMRPTQSQYSGMNVISLNKGQEKKKYPLTPKQQIVSTHGFMWKKFSCQNENQSFVWIQSKNDSTVVKWGAQEWSCLRSWVSFRDAHLMRVPGFTQERSQEQP